MSTDGSVPVTLLNMWNVWGLQGNGPSACYKLQPQAAEFEFQPYTQPDSLLSKINL